MVLVALAVVWALRARRDRRLAVAIASLGLAAPWLCGAEPLLATALAAHAALFVLMRTVELVRERVPRTARWQLASLLLVLDLRALQTGPRHFPWADAGRLLGYLLLAWSSACVVVDVAPAQGAAGCTLRWLAGAALVYAVADAHGHALTVVLAAIGRRGPPMQDVPIRARSVREFWGRRWNLNVSRWIRRNVHRPAARRVGPVAGVAAAFVFSAAAHVYLVLGLDELWVVFAMGAFFVVQGAAAVLEGRLGVQRWPRWAQHAWTIAAVAGPSPLFVEPFLRVVLPSPG
ncbi:MAG: MBOAT family protein [Myxococcota bacterium]